jgi:predicted dehydrogenase
MIIKTHALGKPPPIRFGVIGLEHGHVNVMTAGLIGAGAIPVWVHDADPSKVSAFISRFPEFLGARSEEEILGDDSIQLIVTAAVPDQRGPLSIRAMRSGKDLLSAKPAFTTLAQLEECRLVTKETGRRFFIFYSERLDVRSALMAEEIIEEGRLGEIVQVMCLAPHRLLRETRPPWFFDPKRSGGILGDIGSHQFEQILSYGKISKGSITHALTSNHSVPEFPDFEDFGEATMTGINGVAGYVRVDWLTPDGLGVWGDVRTKILGTKGTLEIRKYTDVAKDRSPDHLFLVDATGEHHLRPHPEMPMPYFRNLLTDCTERSEKAMSQDHAFLAMELALKAQAMAHQSR